MAGTLVITAGASLLFTATLGSGKLCLLREKCPPKAEQQPSQRRALNPDEFHFDGLDRLIVATYTKY